MRSRGSWALRRIAGRFGVAIRAIVAIRMRLAKALELVRVLDGCVGSVASAGVVRVSSLGRSADFCPEGEPSARPSLEWTRPTLGEA